ncbi:MAG: Pycsar system effector family protein [Candidatus Neomarinimicrobiota bacterium]
MPGQSFQLLFHILQSEQSILARTDQKAYALLSVLGVFMVFFIVYYRMLVLNIFIIALLAIYFGPAFLTIWSLVNTIQPRLHREARSAKGNPYRLDPTFFGGIQKFPSSDDYYAFLREIEEDDDYAVRLLSRQVHALATINWIKNSHLRRGIYCFIVALGAELLMILSTFIKGGLESLS